MHADLRRRVAVGWRRGVGRGGHRRSAYERGRVFLFLTLRANVVPVSCSSFPVLVGPHGRTPMTTGLYDPAYEHDACGVGMVADLHGRADHDIVDRGLTVLERLAHRGASGAEASTGDGAG